MHIAVGWTKAVWNTKFAWHFYTWPALGIKPQTFWSWVQPPVHLAMYSHYKFELTLYISSWSAWFYWRYKNSPWYVSLQNGDELPSDEEEEDGDTGHDAKCKECRNDGELLLCDFCTYAYHLDCLNPVLLVSEKVLEAKNQSFSLAVMKSVC